QETAPRRRHDAGTVTRAMQSEAVQKASWRVLRVKLEGANQNPAVIGIDQLPGKANYFIGRHSWGWKTNVPTYAKVKYENVYPGVDVVYHSSSQHELEYDFVVGT